MLERSARDPKCWDILESHYLSRKPWLTLRQDRVRLPTGVTLDEYFVWEYPDWVNVVAVTDDDRLVMLRQYRHGLGRVAYEIPAGVVDATDADPESAARRELLEETGYGGGSWTFLLACSANPGTHNNLTHSFLAVGVKRLADPTPDATEDLSVELIAAGDARNLVLSGEIVQALHLAPLLKYFLSRAGRPNCSQSW